MQQLYDALQSLAFASSDISGDVPKAPPQLQHITRLEAVLPDLLATGLLRHTPRLRHLFCDSDEGVDEEDISASVFAHCADLQHLKLEVD